MFGLLLTEISSLRNADNRHLNASWLSSCVLCAKRLFLNICQWWRYMQWLYTADSLLKAFKTLYGDSILSCLVLISYKSCCNAVVNSPWQAAPLTIMAPYTAVIIIQIHTLIHNQLIYTCPRNALFLHIPYSGIFSKTTNLAVFVDFTATSKINPQKSYYSIQM